MRSMRWGTAAALASVVAIAVGVIAVGAVVGRVSKPPTARELGRHGLQPLEPTATPTQDPYPGGTPGFGPTPTAIPTEDQKYAGWTGEDIADDFGTRMVATPDPWSSVPTTYEDSAEITTGDFEALGLSESTIGYQSPTDMAIILGGDFMIPHRGGTLATQAPVGYILLVVDTYSGAVRLRVESNNLTELQAMLP